MIGTRLSHYEIVAKLGEGGVVGGCFAGRRPFLHFRIGTSAPASVNHNG
jgi:hypothetical protein